MDHANQGDLPYRAGVGIMLLNADNQVFVARRIDMASEAWQMPQGGIDAGETPAAAARRELAEEVGTDKAVILAESPIWRSYDLPAELTGRLWGGRYRGQSQKWFAMRFTGADRDINIDTPEPEFMAWKWVAMAEVPRLIVPFKRKLYEEIVAEFAAIVDAAAH